MYYVYNKQGVLVRTVLTESSAKSIARRRKGYVKRDGHIWYDYR